MWKREQGNCDLHWKTVAYRYVRSTVSRREVAISMMYKPDLKYIIEDPSFKV